MFDERARLTVPDVILLLASLAFFAALYPVFWSGFEARVADMDQGTALLFQLILPLGLLVFLSVMWLKATSRGVGR